MLSDHIRTFVGTPKGDWENKINFVDARNTVVGFDWEHQCCERFWCQWLDSDRNKIEGFQEGSEPEMTETIEGFWFDTDYHEIDSGDHHGCEEESWAEFRITNGKEERFLRLYNCQNGYYTHGFDMQVNGATKFEGGL